MEVGNHPKTFKMKNPQEKNISDPTTTKAGPKTNTNHRLPFSSATNVRNAWHLSVLHFFFFLLSERLNLERSAHPFGKNLFL